MNIQQFNYVLAVAELKHFEQAAEKCFVTQSTLSTMLNKFEDEIGIKIFDRKTKPVSITKEGEEIIKQLKIIVKEIDALDYKVQELKGEMIGELRIGIISTVAPYLLPLFLIEFAQKFPNINIVIQEINTKNIQKELKKRDLDIGIVAVPLNDKDVLEFSLFDEPFVLFNSSDKQHKINNLNDIDFSKLLLLEEGHCLRTQVEQIFRLNKLNKKNNLNFEFRAGSIESLVRFTKANKGITLLPYLATIDLKEREMLQEIETSVPMRSVGLVTHKNFVKIGLLKEIQAIIKRKVKPLIPEFNEKYIVSPL